MYELSEIKDYLDLYKLGKIRKETFAAEVVKRLGLINDIEVSLVKKATSSGNGTFAATILPEYIDGMIKITFIFDEDLVKNVLSGDEMVLLLNQFKRYYNIASKELFSFYSMNEGTEVPLSACIEVYVKIYAGILKSFPEVVLAKLREVNALSSASLDDLLLALELNTETNENIIENILVKNLLPKESIELAKKLFERLNPFNEIFGQDVGIDELEQNKFSDKIDAITTPVTDEHKDYDLLANPEHLYRG